MMNTWVCNKRTFRFIQTLFAVLLATVFLTTAVAKAYDDDEEEAPRPKKKNHASDKKKQKKQDSKVRRSRNDDETDDEVPRKHKKKRVARIGEGFYQHSAVKGILGVATSVGSQTTIVFGADYIHPLGDQLTLTGGLSYWRYSVANAAVSDLTIDGGVGYHFDLSEDSTIEAGGRLGLAVLTITIPGLSGIYGGSISGSYLEITPYAAFNYSLGSSGIVGAELRKPIFLSSLVGDYSGFYILGFYRYNFD